MMGETQRNITTRLHTHLIKRLDTLTNSSLVQDPGIAPRGKLKRADILREAVTIGVTELEKRAEEIENKGFN